MTIPYFYASANAKMGIVAEVILNHVSALRCSSFKTYNKEIISALDKVKKQFEENTCEKSAYFSKKIDLNQITSLHIQDGDGDNGFT